MTQKLVLGLGRHVETEAIGAGASLGARFLFSSLEDSLDSHFRLVRVPPYYYSTDGRRSLRVAIDVLHEVDACLFGLPPSAFDLDPFFLVRDRLNKRIPFVYMPLGEFPRGAWCYRNIHQHLRTQDVLLFSSRADRAIHDALVASTPARVAVVPFGIQAERFRTPESMRATTRRHLGIGPDEIVFVYHGRATAEKNVHGTIMLFRHIAREHPATRLWVIGRIEESPDEFGTSAAAPDALTTAFSAMLHADGLAERVTFWGGLASEAMPRMLSAADIALSLTVNGDENFGYGIVEAMAAGLPVIGTDWGGLKDTIEHGVTGFLVPTVVTPIGVAVDHWRAWQSARALLESTERRQRMGAAAQARVARAFSLEQFAAVIAEQIRKQILTCCETREARHVWSAFGKRFSETYSTPVTAGSNRVLPRVVPATRTLFADHPLMRRVLVPYATRTHSVRYDCDSVFFLATELLDVRGATVQSSDPRYVFSIRLIHAVDRAVISLLRKHGFCNQISLIQQLEPRFDSSSVHASLRRLLRKGIVLQSDKRRELTTRMGDKFLAVRTTWSRRDRAMGVAS